MENLRSIVTKSDIVRSPTLTLRVASLHSNSQIRLKFGEKNLPKNSPKNLPFHSFACTTALKSFSHVVNWMFGSYYKMCKFRHYETMFMVQLVYFTCIFYCLYFTSYHCLSVTAFNCFSCMYACLHPVNKYSIFTQQAYTQFFAQQKYFCGVLKAT